MATTDIGCTVPFRVPPPIPGPPEADTNLADAMAGSIKER
jgi:hypothetical protein